MTGLQTEEFQPLSQRPPSALMSLERRSKVQLGILCIKHSTTYLRGGTRAQKRFYELHIKDLDDLLNLQLIHPDPNKLPSITYQSDELIKLDKKLCRAWTNKGDAYTVEYVTNEIYHPGDIVKTKEYFDVVEEDTCQDLVPVNSLPNCPISPPSSLPNSDFSMSCRCGLSGDGNILY